MKLHIAANEGQQLFTGYGDGYVAVNNVRYERSVLVTPSAVADWTVRTFEDITPADFQFLGTLKPEVVVFGTGLAQRFPRPELARALAAWGVGVEIMDSRAACRTYNILAAEGRNALAAILLE